MEKRDVPLTDGRKKSCARQRNMSTQEGCGFEAAGRLGSSLLFFSNSKENGSCDSSLSPRYVCVFLSLSLSVKLGPELIYSH